METTKYEVRGWIKNSEEDKYDEGCIGQYFSDSGKDYFEADTVKELIEKLMRFVGTDNKEDVDLNSCDEAGRVDIQILEDEEGVMALRNDIEEWKQGNIRLWLANYSFQVQLVTRESITINEGDLS